jgi:tRNA A58 N-methylase Trm61
MIQEACVAIDQVSERDRRAREAKYARRNKMRYIDQLLNELEMLNLAEQREMPQALSVAVDQLRVDSDVEAILDMPKPDSVIEAMDVLYEIQDSLMFNQIDDE